MAALIEFRAENFKRLSAVELKPQPNGTVIIAGRNGQGKSSILDGIMAALCGKNSIDEVPVRVGSDESIIEATISTEPPLRIVRRIKSDGKTTLTITQKNGDIESKVSKPQQVLDALVGTVAFDPLAFTRLTPAKQIDLLKALVGVDTAELDEAIAKEMEERKLVNRDVERAKADFEAMPHHLDAPDLPVNVDELLRELTEANNENAIRAELSEEVEGKRVGIEDLKDHIERLKASLQKAEEDLRIARTDYREKKALLDQKPLIDTEPLSAKIASASAINEQVSANRERERAKAKLRERTTAADTLTKSIEDLRQRRMALMDSAKWPVKGLGFGSKGVTFNDLPFTQCSSAEQLRISTAIGLSQNPKLRMILIRDGSLLDDDSLAMLHALAIEHDAQIIVERVGTGIPGEIVIEDGHVAGVEELAEAAS